MTLLGILIFCGVYGLAVATPGPGIAAVVARVLGRGTAGVVPFLGGFVIGDLTLFAVAAAGLSVIAQTFAEVFIVLRWLGAAYLLYMAYRLWTAPAVVPEATEAAVPREHGLRLFLTGLTVTLSNPKPIIFFMALLPTVVDLTTLTLADGLLLAGCIAVVMSMVLGTYALAAARARRLLRSAKAVRWVNRGTGAVMAGAAAAIAAR